MTKQTNQKAISHFAANGFPGDGGGEPAQGNLQGRRAPAGDCQRKQRECPLDRYRECEAYLQRKEERGQTQGNWRPDDPNRKLPAS